MATSHTRGLHRIGEKVTTLANPVPVEGFTAIGRAIDAAIKAGLKASIPGLQTDKQVNSVMVKFRQGFSRQLTAEIKAGATNGRGSV